MVHQETQKQYEDISLAISTEMPNILTLTLQLLLSIECIRKGNPSKLI